QGGYDHEHGDDDEASVPRTAEGAPRATAGSPPDRSARRRRRAGEEPPLRRAREALPPRGLTVPRQTSSSRNPSIGTASQASKSSCSVAAARAGRAASSASALSHTASPINASLRRSFNVCTSSSPCCVRAAAPNRCIESMTSRSCSGFGRWIETWYSIGPPHSSRAATLRGAEQRALVGERDDQLAARVRVQ